MEEVSPRSLSTDRVLKTSYKSRTFLIVTIVLCLIIIVGSGVYFFGFSGERASPQYFQGANQKTQENSNTTTPPAQVSLPLAPTTVSPTLDVAVWKEYRTKIYTVQYPRGWKFDYYVVENGVQIFNPASVREIPQNGSFVQVIDQYVSISTIESSQSASMYADKIQFNCCIGPSATPGSASKFKKSSITINGVNAIAYTPVGENRNWDIVLSTGKYVIVLYSTISDPLQNSIENQLINSIKLL